MAYFSIIIFPIGLIQLIGRGINRIITRNLLLPGLNHSKIKLDEARNHFMSAHPNCCERIAIRAADRTKLDAIIVKNQNQINLPFEEKKFIIFFNGNGGTYEHELPFLMHISNATGADILCGNYRGIGYSEGFPRGYKDLMMDGEAQIQYLLSRGVNQKNILIHGWSLGGGVGAHLAVHHQDQGKEISFCSDRSFASMVDEVKAISQNMRTNLRRHQTCMANYFAHLVSAATFIVVGVIRALGWNFQSLECYKKIQGHKFIIYHQKDPVIPHAASLFKKLTDEQNNNTEHTYHLNAIRLSDDIENDMAHGIPINQTPQFQDYIAQVARAG